MPLPPSAPAELLPDPDRAAAALSARTRDARWPGALAALLAEAPDHPFDGFVVSAADRLAGPVVALSEAVADVGGSSADPVAAPFVTRVVSAGWRLDRLMARLAEYAEACAGLGARGGHRAADGTGDRAGLEDLEDLADLDVEPAVVQALGDLGTLGQPVPADVRVSAPGLPLDPALLRLLLRHLLGNAALYAGASGGTVTVTGRRDHGRWELSVADDGPGIPTADRLRVLQPLVRLDRDRATPGDGLGLAICSRVARAHGGRISVNRAQGGGASLRLVGSLR